MGSRELVEEEQLESDGRELGSVSERLSRATLKALLKCSSHRRLEPSRPRAVLGSVALARRHEGAGSAVGKELERQTLG